MEYYHPCLQNKSKVTLRFANKMLYASVPSNIFYTIGALQSKLYKLYERRK